MDTHEPDLTIKEVCHLLSVSRTLVWRLISYGELKAHKVGRSVRIQQREIERFKFVNQIIPH
jgi:excisionase family DNA binding protein